MHVLRRMVDAQVPVKRRREMQNSKWKVRCKRDIESVELTVDDLLNRIKWKRDIHNHSDDPRRWGKPEKKKKMKKTTAYPTQTGHLPRNGIHQNIVFVHLRRIQSNLLRSVSIAPTSFTVASSYSRLHPPEDLNRYPNMTLLKCLLRINFCKLV